MKLVNAERADPKNPVLTVCWKDSEIHQIKKSYSPGTDSNSSFGKKADAIMNLESKNIMISQFKSVGLQQKEHGES